MHWENMRIKSTYLGYEDHGIFTCILDCQTEGSGQGFGCRVLNEPLALKNFIEGVLKVVGVDSWEKVAGQLIRVSRVERFGVIVAIRPVVRDGPIFMPGNDLSNDPGLFDNEDDLP